MRSLPLGTVKSLSSTASVILQIEYTLIIRLNDFNAKSTPDKIFVFIVQSAVAFCGTNANILVGAA